MLGFCLPRTPWSFLFVQSVRLFQQFQPCSCQRFVLSLVQDYEPPEGRLEVSVISFLQIVDRLYNALFPLWLSLTGFADF